MLEENIPLVEGFQVYLSDQESANAFHRKKFNIEGVELRANVKDLGYIQYGLKIHKEIYLENNEKYSCKNYQINDYNEVSKYELKEFNTNNNIFSVFKIYIFGSYTIDD